MPMIIATVWANQREEISCVIADSQVKRFSISVNALSDNPRRFCWTRKAGGVWEWEWEGVGAECVVRACVCAWVSRRICGIKIIALCVSKHNFFWPHSESVE